jgi:hypothetical protein
LLNLNNGELSGANAQERLQLVQEFFFHLVGATEVLAQLVNEVRGLGIDSEQVEVYGVANTLPATDPIKAPLDSLYTRTRRQPLPADPYSDEGYMFRILNYRNQVTHRHRNPFQFVIHLPVGAKTSPAQAYLLLDSRDPTIGASNKTAQDELHYMLTLIKTRCEKILSVL